MIVEDRYGNGSTIVTSQLPVDAWHDVIDEPTFADAILDRLVHNVHRLPLDGPPCARSSMRNGARRHEYRPTHRHARAPRQRYGAHAPPRAAPAKPHPLGLTERSPDGIRKPRSAASSRGDRILRVWAISEEGLFFFYNGLRFDGSRFAGSDYYALKVEEDGTYTPVAFELHRR